ncbi:MAG: hypothetical protein KC434_08110 [Anaerolineales bacterium]|nr:hypothetical protein [Anaerolineales bacterium]
MKIDIEITAVFQTPFNVGTGALANIATNRPTIKDGRQQAIIPGSSYKGRLRHTCERLLRTLQQTDSAVCQPPVANRMCPLHEAWLGEFCPVCQLFGSPLRHSPLKFSDLHWQESAEAGVLTDIRTGVSIRRSRRVAEPQRLYDQEVFGPLPETIFSGTITGHLPDEAGQPLAALLLAGLRQLHTVGGGQTGGLGHCRFTARIKIDNRPQGNKWYEEGLKQWLATK